MDYEKLKQELAEEARQYLIDIHVLLQSLRTAEGWIVLGLVAASMVMTVIWGLVSLGFSPPNEPVTRLIHALGLRVCKPIDNLSGVIIIIDLFVLLFLTAVSIGNALHVMERVGHGQPREPRDLIVSTSLMLVVGIGGIIFMTLIC